MIILLFWLKVPPYCPNFSLPVAHMYKCVIYFSGISFASNIHSVYTIGYHYWNSTVFRRN